MSVHINILEFRACEFNLLALNELTVALLANVVFTVKYQLTS